MRLQVVDELLQLYPDIPELLAAVSRISGRTVDETAREVREHLAARLTFLLLGEVETAPNFGVIESRLARVLGVSVDDVRPLSEVVANAVVALESADEGHRAGLRDLPYTARRALFERQGNRCGVCGWDFADDTGQRTAFEASACLDHRVPFRLGGDSHTNLWLLCGLCNSIKESRIHVGEHGRVWTNNHVYAFRVRATAFWTLVRDKKCLASSCGRGPEVGRLYAVRNSGRGAWVIDNCAARCDAHVGEGESIDY